MSVRCVQCDNRMIVGWLFCPYCGYPQSDEGIEAAQRELTARQQAQAQVYAHGQMVAALRDSYVALAFAFNRIHVLPRTRDTELARDIGKVRANIEQVLAAVGQKP